MNLKSNNKSRQLIITFPDEGNAGDQIQYDFKGMFRGGDIFRIERSLWKQYRRYMRDLRRLGVAAAGSEVQIESTKDFTVSTEVA